MNHRIEKYLAIATVTPLAGGIAAHADSFFYHYGGETPFLTMSLSLMDDADLMSAALTTSQGLFSIGFDVFMGFDEGGSFVAAMMFESSSNRYGAFHGFDMGVDKKPGISLMREGDKLAADGPEKITNDEAKLVKNGEGAFAGEGEQRGYAGATILLGDGPENDYLSFAWFDIGLNTDEGILTIYDWAWSGNTFDEANPPILFAGQTEASTPVPGAAGIVALAAGAAGIRRRRQRAS